MTPYLLYMFAIDAAFVVALVIAIIHSCPGHRLAAIFASFLAAHALNLLAAEHWAIGLLFAAASALTATLNRRAARRAPRPAWWGGGHEKIHISKETD